MSDICEGHTSLLSILGNMALIFLLLVGVIYFAMTFPSENPQAVMCGDMCVSKGMEYMKYSDYAYENAVCYCKSETGEINTFVM